MKTNSTSISLVLEVIKETKLEKKKKKMKSERTTTENPLLYFTEDIVSDLWHLQAI